MLLSAMMEVTSGGCTGVYKYQWTDLGLHGLFDFFALFTGCQSVKGENREWSLTAANLNKLLPCCGSILPDWWIPEKVEKGNKILCDLVKLCVQADHGLTDFTTDIYRIKIVLQP